MKPLSTLLADARRAAVKVPLNGEIRLRDKRSGKEQLIPYPTAEDVLEVAHAALNQTPDLAVTLQSATLVVVGDQVVARVTLLSRVGEEGHATTVDLPVVPRGNMSLDKAAAAAITQGTAYALRGMLLLRLERPGVDDAALEQEPADIPPAPAPAPAPAPTRSPSDGPPARFADPHGLARALGSLTEDPDAWLEGFGRLEGFEAFVRSLANVAPAAVATIELARGAHVLAQRAGVPPEAMSDLWNSYGGGQPSPERVPSRAQLVNLLNVIATVELRGDA